jgi:hypothetical protein
MANHTEENIGDAVHILKTARLHAEQELEELGADKQPAKRVAA